MAIQTWDMLNNFKQEKHYNRYSYFYVYRHRPQNKNITNKIEFDTVIVQFTCEFVCKQHLNYVYRFMEIHSS